MKKQKITKDMSFSEVLQKYPQTAQVFLKFGMHCIGCAMAANETVEEGAKAHGIEVEKFVEELNKIIK